MEYKIDYAKGQVFKMEDWMSKIKVLVNIVIVCIILFLAVYLPGIVSSYLQKSLEGEINYVDVGGKTYEVKYNNIWEKIVSIHKYEEDGEELETVPIAIEVTEELKENLTRHVEQQFNNIQEGIMYKFSNISKEDLISCEKYAIYSSNEANGISFWNLKYERGKENIQIVMDAEFNYIYFFVLKIKSKNAESIIKNCIKAIKSPLKESYPLWLDNIVHYFNIGADDGEYSYSLDTSVYKYPIYSEKDRDIISFNTVLEYWEADKIDDISPNKKYDDTSASVSDSRGRWMALCMTYDYQRKEKKITIEWGINFHLFENMIQF
ncbi:MAG: hypothetical protein HDT30_04345 [Clostridiales bacterium]|nr:hypothetical protein [Clostridiales bacterium]